VISGDIRLKFYIKQEAKRADLLVAMYVAAQVVGGRVCVGELPDWEFAFYVHTNENHALDNRYYKSISLDLKQFQGVIGVEIFGRKCQQPIWRLVASPPESKFRLPSGKFLRYRLAAGNSRDLVILFDYSRLVSKVILHQECCPRFGYQTSKNVLVLSNAFGYWGTACLFDDAGRYIVPDVVGFINSVISKLGCNRVFIIGGSQGAASALVYGQSISQCVEVFAASPVKVDKKIMLRHLSNTIADSDIIHANNLLLTTFSNRIVNLYSSQGDTHHLYHEALSQYCTGTSQYRVCDDPDVEHGQVLKRFIKEIYRKIDDYSEVSV
jgi:hypothetical protein